MYEVHESNTVERSYLCTRFLSASELTQGVSAQVISGALSTLTSAGKFNFVYIDPKDWRHYMKLASKCIDFHKNFSSYEETGTQRN